MDRLGPQWWTEGCSFHWLLLASWEERLHCRTLNIGLSSLELEHRRHYQANQHIRQEFVFMVDKCLQYHWVVPFPIVIIQWAVFWSNVWDVCWINSSNTLGNSPFWHKAIHYQLKMLSSWYCNVSICQMLHNGSTNIWNYDTNSWKANAKQMTQRAIFNVCS